MLHFQETAKQVRYWLQVVQSNTPRETIVLIAGNKCDKEDRKVSKADVDDYLTYTESVHMDTSAKTGENVDRLFHTIGKRIQTAYIYFPVKHYRGQLQAGSYKIFSCQSACKVEHCDLNY